ncbi:hypothetical protein PR202_gb22491 [Eleusine coracana subsp. coracana]|uniref:CCHC-type domain-containing protein n=1 Tax=Eleusine coracana subsp. coracana TaxID=191504 RepID=A0AAV5FDS5_ELECO|nr:hypothetical protein PR202_gb22491 [Eleusine coracana subsp. coracana]
MDQCTHKQQTRQQAYFLSKMHVLCFNCLAQDHRVAQCRNVVRCWWCYKAGHISSRCPNRHRRQRHGKVNKVQHSGCRRPSVATMWVPVTGVAGSIQQFDKEICGGENQSIEATEEFLNAQWVDGMCAKLQILRVTETNWLPNEISFMKFILSKAQLLRNLSVSHADGCFISHEEPFLELQKCSRASAEVQILLKGPEGE